VRDGAEGHVFRLSLIPLWTCRVFEISQEQSEHPTIEVVIEGVQSLIVCFEISTRIPAVVIPFKISLGIKEGAIRRLIRI
jgi:hypothetical protein